LERIEGCSCKPTPGSRRHQLHLGGGDAPYGTIKVTVNFAKKRNSLGTPVSNVQNMLGVHEYQGDGIDKFSIGGGPHYKAYELQMRDNAPGWGTSTEYYKNYIKSNYNTVKKSER